MTISEFEIKRCEKLVGSYVEQHRLSPHIRNEVDLSYRIKDQSIEIFEIRPRWNEPDQKIEEMVAKTTYVKKNGLWKVYWQRADMKWHSYEPMPEVSSLEEFLELMAENKHNCFYN